jgi:hypothetical protein
MVNASSLSVSQKATRLVLSVPVQGSLYVCLVSLIIWTVYLTTHPAIHNKVHSLRHHTLMVGCH